MISIAESSGAGSVFVGRLAVGVLCAGLLVACGGGGGGGSNRNSVAPPVTPPVTTAPYTKGVYQPYSGLASQCANPRTGTDPQTNQPYPDVKGLVASENNWLRSWINDTYLWYSEVPDLDPNSYSDTLDYFDVLRTSAVTPSGRDKDQFHFTYPTDVWDALSESGEEVGYGAEWFLISGIPPREIRVAYVEPGSPAANAGVVRGDTVLTVDGVDAVNGGTQANVDAIVEGLYPSAANRSHQFMLRDIAGTSRTVTLLSATVTLTPVQNVQVLSTTSGPVGYIQFNAHVATAETVMINAINTLKAANVVDLVLDIRYNGGGYLDLASEVAFMIAGPTRTAGQTFEQLVFNDKYTSTDPVTGRQIVPTPFRSTAQGFPNGAPEGTALPTLDLPRVFVLTGANTCSASESVINGLLGAGVQVIQIGGTTCGKPYGFYPTPNCGTTYFAVQFKGVNAAGFGDYADGFSPVNSQPPTNATITGCSVADDFTQALGNTQEARLAAALSFRESGGNCPTPPSGPVMQSKGRVAQQPGEGVIRRPPWLENRILRR